MHTDGWLQAHEGTRVRACSVRENARLQAEEARSNRESKADRDTSGTAASNGAGTSGAHPTHTHIPHPTRILGHELPCSRA